MENHGDPIPRKKKGTKVDAQRRKIKIVKAAAGEKGRTYGINRLNIDDIAHAENDSLQGEENADRRDSE